MKEPIIGPLKSKIGEIRHLGSCRLNAKNAIFQPPHYELVLRARHSPSPQPKNQTTPWTRSVVPLVRPACRRQLSFL